MKKIQIIADDKIPFLRAVLDDVAEIAYFPGKDISPALVRNADALIIRTRTQCDRSLLGGSSVKFIASATIGFDHIDTEYCSEAGIEWTNAPGCNASSVEQYVISVLLNWSDKRNLNPGSTVLGVIGAGNVGSKIAAAAQSIGMKVMVNDPPRARLEGEEGFVSIETIQKEADVLTFHVPLNKSGADKTLHMCNDAFFNRLDRNVFLINSSRGPVVDSDALEKALISGKVKAACLDVWENEPDISRRLLSLVDFGTPHIAGYSTDGKANGTMMSVRAVSRFFGLGLDDWTPSDLPLPENPSFVVDCTGLGETDILREVYLNTYDVKLDDEMLREDISRFEFLRGHYPIRREATAYSVRLINNPFDHLEEILGKLGFSVLVNSCF